MALSLYRRHTPACTHKKPIHDKTFTKCSCVCHLTGTINGSETRVSLHTRDWREASKMLLEAEARGYWRTPNGGIGSGKSIQEAVDLFLADAKSDKGRGLREATMAKYETLCRRLCEFARKRSLTTLAELTPEHVRDFRDTWPVAPRSCANYMNSLRCMMRFFLENEWIDKSPAAAVKPPKAAKGEEHKKHPFTEEEVRQIVEEAGKRSRELQTFVLLLRHSGLRLSDATFLRRKQIAGNTLHIVTIKTRGAVTLPIPEWLTERLLEIEPKSEDGHIFTDNTLRLGPATDKWRRQIHPILKQLGIKGKTCHCFRHTFATDLLAKGIDLTLVSRLLTHSTTSITERFYASWVKSRQERLESEMKKVWDLEKAA